MLKRIIPLFFITLFLVKCAYFNTFYNAERYYKNAYRETKKNRTDKITGSERSNYQKSVEKSQKLIEYYPDSKYVDDALLLMGKAYYQQHDYLKAERRLIELTENYPNSTLIPEAMLYLAKTHVALELFEQAEDEFKKLSKASISKELKSETYFYLGKLYDRRSFFQKSMDAYQEAIKSASEEFKAEALFALGVCCDTLGIFDQASEAFEKVQDYNPSLELQFESQLRYAQSLKREGKVDLAIRTLEDLLGMETDKNRLPIIRLEIADCLTRKGDIDGAIISYQDVTKDFPKTVHSAKAYYILGKLLESKRRDYSRALEQFNQVKKEYARSEYADSSEIKARGIMRMQALEQVILMAQKGQSGDVMVVETEKANEDTLSAEYIYAVMDTISNDSLRTVFLAQLWGKAFVDSILTDPEVYKQQKERERLYRVEEDKDKEEASLVDWAKWIQDGKMPSYSDLEEELLALKSRIKKPDTAGLAENPELKAFKVEEVDKNRFLLAELYWFRFSLFDSAFAQYRSIVDEYPKSRYAARSLYNLGYLANEIYQDSLLADSLNRKLILTYPQSTVAKTVRRQLNLSDVQTQGDSVEDEFEKAEKILFEQKNPDEAYNVYQSIWEKYPESDWAARALYSMGWICEFRLDSLQLAFVLYDSLMQNYPESVYAKRVQSKVQAVQSAEQEKQRNGKEVKESGEESITLKQPVLYDSISDSAVADTSGGLSLQSIPYDTLSGQAAQGDSTIQNHPGQHKKQIKIEPELIKENSREKSQEEAGPPDDLMAD